VLKHFVSFFNFLNREFLKKFIRLFVEKIVGCRF